MWFLPQAWEILLRQPPVTARNWRRRGRQRRGDRIANNKRAWQENFRSEANDYRCRVKASTVAGRFWGRSKFALTARNKPACRFDRNELHARVNDRISW